MSLVAHYKFENDIKNELQGYTTTSGSLTFNSDGIVGYSAIFNGSTYITFDSTFYLNHNANWTVSVWIKTTSSNTMSILSNSSGGPVYNDLRIHGGKITYYHYNGAWYTKQGSTLINDGRWHNLTWVNFSHSRMNMYVDGVLDLSMADSTMSSGGAINRIGYNWGGNAFIGEMDEFKIYNDSSLSRINELAFNQDLVRHWPMLGNLSDYSGYNRDLINSTGTNTSASGKIGLGLTKTSGYYSSGMTIIPDEVTISLW
jgi:hypothetical protein